MENASIEISVDPSPAADISPPPPPDRMDRLNAVRPWFALVSAAVRSASLSSSFLGGGGDNKTIIWIYIGCKSSSIVVLSFSAVWREPMISEKPMGIM